MIIFSLFLQPATKRSLIIASLTQLDLQMIFHYFSISLFQWLRKYYFNTSRLWRTETDVLRCLCLFLSSTSEPKHWHSESVWLQSVTSQSCPDHLLQLFLFNNMLQSSQLGSSIKRDIKIITSIKHSCIKHKFVYVRTSCKRMKNLMKVFPVSTRSSCSATDTSLEASQAWQRRYFDMLRLVCYRGVSGEETVS